LQFGYRENELVGNSIFKLVHAEYTQKMVAGLKNIAAGNSAHNEMEMMTPIGKRNIEYNSNPIWRDDTACLQVNSAPAFNPKPLGAVAGLGAWIGCCAFEMLLGTLIVVLGLILVAASVHVRRLSLFRSQKLMINVSVVNANGYMISGG